MAKIETWLNCDLQKAVQAQALTGNVFSQDNNGNRILVRIFNGGQKATVSGSVTANCILADGSTVNVNGTLTSADGQSVAYVDIPQGVLLVPGTLKIAIKLTDSGVITTLAAIVTTVYQTKTDNVITPSQQIINDWNAEISAAIATQDAAIANQDTKIDDLKSALNNKIGLISSGTKNLIMLDNTLVDAVITSSGVVQALSGYGNLYVAPIEQGKTYTFNSNDASQLYGIFSSIPVIGSTTYNNSRSVDGTHKFVAPITGYVAFRSGADYAYTQIEEGETNTSYIAPITANDKEARAEIGQLQNDIEVGERNFNPAKMERLLSLQKNQPMALYDGTKSEKTYESYSGSNYYRICYIGKETLVKSIKMRIPSATHPIALFVYDDNGTKKVEKKITFSNGGSGTSLVEENINYQTTNDCYLYIGSGFYFAVEDSLIDIPYIINTSVSEGDSIPAANIVRGTKDMSYQMIVESASAFFNSMKETLDDANAEIYDAEKDVYSGLTAGDTYELFSGPDYYSICEVREGTKIDSISVINRNGVQAYFVFVYVENQTYKIEKSFTLNPGNGSTFVDTNIQYTTKHNCILFLNAFGFAISTTRTEIPLIATIGSGQISNVHSGTRALDYTVIIKADTLKRIVNELVSAEDQGSVLFQASCLSMLKTMGTCGDSYTAGMIALSDPNRIQQDTDRSWGKVLERHYGIDVSVYAKGGVTAKTYLNTWECLTKLLSETAKEAYAISLGHNDMYTTGTSGWTEERIDAYIGTIESLVGEYTDYPDTFIGNYARIIEQIQEHAPNAMILLLRQTRPYASYNGGTKINNAISALGEHYGLPVFDPELDPYLSSETWINTMSRNHPLYMGYAGMAEAFARMFNYYTTVYPEYFGAFDVDDENEITI